MQRKKFAFSAVVTLALVALLLSGCLVHDKPETLVFSVSDTILDFDSEVTELQINVSANVDWSATSTRDWITLDRTSGHEDSVVTVTIDRSDKEARGYNGAIKFTSTIKNIDVVVTMVVMPEPTAPGQVQELEVLGLTVPSGFVVQSAYELISETLANRSDVTLQDDIFVANSPMPENYVGYHSLSWEPVANATHYRILRQNGDMFEVVDRVDASTLEIVDGRYVYVMAEGSALGSTPWYTVQAENAVGVGNPSWATRGVVLNPTYLLSPSNQTATPAKPTFVWTANPDMDAYTITVYRGQKINHLWQVVLTEGERVTYGYSDSDAPALEPGNVYGWFVSTTNADVTGLSLSQAWTFSVQ